jgi:hypothetical protein
LKEHNMNIMTSLQRLTAALTGWIVRPASAHCDTADGPAVVDGRRALASGNANIALKWVHADAEAELRPIFERALRVYQGGGEAAELAEQWFLENLVRIHRAGEGASYDGIKPIGTHVPPQVRAADEALERGNIEPLRGLIDAERWGELEKRFDRALALKNFDTDDLMAARGYMDAYVSFFKYAEGHDHDHAHAHAAHGHGHAHGAAGQH